jgi:hypothetical protein
MLNNLPKGMHPRNGAVFEASSASKAFALSWVG